MVIFAAMEAILLRYFNLDAVVITTNMISWKMKWAAKDLLHRNGRRTLCRESLYWLIRRRHHEICRCRDKAIFIRKY